MHPETPTHRCNFLRFFEFWIALWTLGRTVLSRARYPWVNFTVSEVTAGDEKMADDPGKLMRWMDHDG